MEISLGSNKFISMNNQLPHIEIGLDQIRIGNSVFSSNMILNCEVGVLVTAEGIAIGARLPDYLRTTLQIK